MNNKTVSRTASAYCKAYCLGTLRGVPGWEDRRRQAGACADLGSLDDSTIVYLHADLSVTRDVFAGEAVLVPGDHPQWREFCERELGFSVPADLLPVLGAEP